MSQPTNPPIVVSGGSVTIEYDSKIFTPNSNGKHSNANKKIKSIVVEVEGDAPQTFNVPNGKVTVTINYGNSQA